MTPDELRPILQSYRKQVEQGWSKATSHPSFEGADGSPVGQCGVTSAWLQQRLKEDHGIEAFCALGAVYNSLGLFDTRHCWLEIGEGCNPLIVDLIADQYGLPEVVCDTHHELILRDWFTYEADTLWSLQPASGEEVESRFAILTKALS